MLVIAFENYSISFMSGLWRRLHLNIVNTAVERSTYTNFVGIIGQDTDVAVILTVLAPADK